MKCCSHENVGIKSVILTNNDNDNSNNNERAKIMKIVIIITLIIMILIIKVIMKTNIINLPRHLRQIVLSNTWNTVNGSALKRLD